MATGSDLVRVDLSGGGALHRSPALTALGVPHAFTTRLAWDGADLGSHLLGELGLSARTGIASLTQVHGAEVHDVSAQGARLELRGDALVSELPGRVLLVRAADCVPVLLAGPAGRRVAAVHAGWRGIVAGVLPAALEALGEGPLTAAIGPCVSAARFEVGPDVAREFACIGLADAVVASAGARPHIDLRLATSLQLERAGVQHIDVSRRCTWDDLELFSHRRDVTHGGQTRTGRLGALITPAC